MCLYCVFYLARHSLRTAWKMSYRLVGYCSFLFERLAGHFAIVFVVFSCRIFFLVSYVQEFLKSLLPKVDLYEFSLLGGFQSHLTISACRKVKLLILWREQIQLAWPIRLQKLPGLPVLLSPLYLLALEWLLGLLYLKKSKNWLRGMDLLLLRAQTPTACQIH